MGFFNKPDAAAIGLAPLTSGRIKEALEGLAWKYSVDEEGDIAASWDDGFFYFLQRGKNEEILYVRGTWRPDLTLAEQAQADGVCTEWNRSTLWPKAYTVAFDDGVVRVCCEHTVDYEFGLTDKQLTQHLICVVNTGLDLFEKLNEAFPALAAAAKG